VEPAWMRGLAALAFLGGSAAPLAFVAPWMLARARLVAAVGGAVLAGLLLAFVPLEAHAHFDPGAGVGVRVQAALWIAVAAGALALAAREAQGELFARQDDDDLSEPTRLALQVAEFDRHAGLGVLGSAARVIGEQGEALSDYPVPLGQSAIARTLERATPFVHGAVMLRRTVYEAAGGYREVFRASQDLDLWLRLPSGTGLANLPQPLYQWRSHKSGTYARARESQLFYSAAARAFAAERRESGTDSADLLRTHNDPMSFAAAYRRGGDFLRLHGELLVRDGRTAPARRALAAALRAGRWDALPWWLISWPVALTPRARRAGAKS